MLERARSRLTYANVVATVALFLALAGGTTAIALKGKNTVKSDDLAKNSVKTDDIAGDAVQASEVADGAVGASEVADNSLGSAEVDESTLNLVPSVRTRARGNAPLEIPVGVGGKAFQNYPLTDNTWQQAAGETDMAIVEANVSSEFGCGITDHGLQLRVLIDGKLVAAPPIFNVFSGSATVTAGPFANFESGDGGQRTVTVEVSSQCNDEITVESMKVNVIGFV